MNREDAELDPEALADPLEGDDAPAVIDVEAEDAPKRALAKAGTRAVRSYDPFRLYMAEIKKYPPLSREEEQRLARLYRETGDRDALFQLVTANLMLVVRIAFSFRRAAKNLLDLVQEGNVGLLAAIDRFRPDVGARLPTYAAWWIRAYMVKFLLDNVRLVRVGTTNARRKLLRNLHKEKQKLESMGFDVGPKLLAEHLDVSEDDVVQMEQRMGASDLSLNAPARRYEDSSSEIGDTIPIAGSSAEEQVGDEELRRVFLEKVGEFAESLDERDRQIVEQRILAQNPRTLNELGKEFGVSRERVRQLEVRLVERLREYMQEHLVDFEYYAMPGG